MCFDRYNCAKLFLSFYKLTKFSVSNVCRFILTNLSEKESVQYFYLLCRQSIMYVYKWSKILTYIFWLIFTCPNGFNKPKNRFSTCLFVRHRCLKLNSNHKLLDDNIKLNIGDYGLLK